MPPPTRIGQSTTDTLPTEVHMYRPESSLRTAAPPDLDASLARLAALAGATLEPLAASGS